MNHVLLKSTDFQSGLESFLNQLLSKRSGCLLLYDAMRYSLLNGGKRIRANLVYLIGKNLHLSREVLDVLASAIEMVHAFSLIHDDLPGMDNDDMRRGKPSCHIAFGEALAILAGDALHTEAFSLLSRSSLLNGLPAERRLRLIDCLSAAVGAEGMVSGQAIDMTLAIETATLDSLLECHRIKTGNLIQASVLFPVIASGLAEQDELYSRYSQLGELLGLVFQVQDDILDQVASSEQLGKTAGKDLQQGKITFPRLIGLAESEEWVQRLSSEIMALLPKLEVPTEELYTFIHAFVSRNS